VIEVAPLCSATVLVGGVAVLALSLAAKLADWDETRILWPVTGAVRRIAGPAQVTTIEAAVVAAALVPALPVPVRLALIGLLFAAYAAAVLLLRGRRCACFGNWMPTRFTVGHAAGCAGVAVLAACGAGPLGRGSAPGLGRGPGPGLAAALAWAATAQAAAGLTLASLIALIALLAGRDRRRRAEADPPRPPAAIDHIVIYTAESCGFCTALEAQRGRYEAMADCPVEFRRAGSEEDIRAADGKFPAAVAYGPDGLPVSAAAHGLAGIRDLLHSSAAPSGADDLRRPKAEVTT
jgi:hypothetical protein